MKSLLGIGALGWLAVCGIAGYLAMSYEFRPGLLGSAPASWPTETALMRESDTMTVVAFLHPRCVCSRATVTQLVRTIDASSRITLLVPVFVPPEPAPAQEWIENDYARTIRAAIPHAHIIPDRGGIEAERFGAFTSGTILVYDAAGQEVFRGGITSRRGGEEENPGRQRLARMLSGETSAAHATPSSVFGCPLITHEQLQQRGAHGPAPAIRR